MSTPNGLISASTLVAPLPQWRDQGEPGHAVQFYSDDGFLLDELGRFIGTALGAGDGAIVIATPGHRDGLAKRLNARGLDVAVALDQGRYLPLDAAETLSAFMIDGRPDAARFVDIVGGHIARVTAALGSGRPRLAMFGEMVALLWADGNPEAALQLEQLWNGLAKMHSFSLRCAYPITGFCREEDSDQFLQICSTHSAVIPAEGYTALTSEEQQLRNITQLQQSSQVFEAEVAERKRLQQELETRVRARTADLQRKNLELMEEITRRVRAEDGLRALTGRLLVIRDEERRRVARELHDSTAQVLAALGINLSLLEAEKSSLNSYAADLVGQSAVLVNSLLKEVRNLSHWLHPPTLDDIGLSSALQWYIEQFAQRTGIQVSLQLATDLGRLRHDIEVAIFRIVQECLTNVHRHSRSATATVRISQDSREVLVEISDQGRGIPPEKMAPSSESIGIGEMRERVRRLRGTIDIHSNGHGTVVSARFPY